MTELPKVSLGGPESGNHGLSILQCRVDNAPFKNVEAYGIIQIKRVLGPESLTALGKSSLLTLAPGLWDCK